MLPFLAPSLFASLYLALSISTSEFLSKNKEKVCLQNRNLVATGPCPNNYPDGEKIVNVIYAV